MGVSRGAGRHALSGEGVDVLGDFTEGRPHVTGVRGRGECVVRVWTVGNRSIGGGADCGRRDRTGQPGCTGVCRGRAGGGEVREGLCQ